jgi:hypothetical protein
MPTIEHLMKLASVLDAPMSRLLGEDVTEVPNSALALADALKGLSEDQTKFVFDLILLYKQSHSPKDQ